MPAPYQNRRYSRIVAHGARGYDGGSSAARVAYGRYQQMNAAVDPLGQDLSYLTALRLSGADSPSTNPLAIGGFGYPSPAGTNAPGLGVQGQFPLSQAGGINPLGIGAFPAAGSNPQAPNYGGIMSTPLYGATPPSSVYGIEGERKAISSVEGNSFGIGRQSLSGYEAEVDERGLDGLEPGFDGQGQILKNGGYGAESIPSSYGQQRYGGAAAERYGLDRYHLFVSMILERKKSLEKIR